MNILLDLALYKLEKFGLKHKLALSPPEDGSHDLPPTKHWPSAFFCSGGAECNSWLDPVQIERVR